MFALAPQFGKIKNEFWTFDKLFRALQSLWESGNFSQKAESLFFGDKLRALKIRQKAHAKISRAISPKTMQLANTPPKKHHKLLKISAFAISIIRKNPSGSTRLRASSNISASAPSALFAPSNSLRILLLTDTAPADYPRRESAHILHLQYTF